MGFNAPYITSKDSYNGLIRFYKIVVFRDIFYIALV